MRFLYANLTLFRTVILFLSIFYTGYGFFLYFFQENLIYYPFPQDFNSCADFKSAEKLNHNGTRIYFKNNGLRIMVFYHGNAGSACDRKFIADFIEEQGYSYVFPEYAGYSNDSVRPSHALLKKDVKNVISFLDEKKFSEIIIFAESIGAGPASYHMSLQAPNKLIFMSPFSSLYDLAKINFWYYPVGIMVDDAFRNTELLGKFSGPVMILHGSNDRIIPMRLGEKLFKVIGSQEKEFVIISGAGHNDIFNFQETYNALRRFLKPTK